MKKGGALVVALSLWFSALAMEKNTQVNQQSNCKLFKLPGQFLSNVFYTDSRNPTWDEVKAVCKFGQLCKKTRDLVKKNNWFVPVDDSINNDMISDIIFDVASENDYILTLLKSSLSLKLNNIHYKALMSNCTRLVKFLVQKGVEIKDKQYYLWKAVKDDREFLLDQGATANGLSIAMDELPLHSVPVYRWDQPVPDVFYKVPKLLLKNGADLNIVGGSKTSPLIEACNDGALGLVELYIEHGAKLNYQDNDGKTVLHHACEKGFLDIVKLLVDKGIDVNITDTYNRTAVWYTYNARFFNNMVGFPYAGEVNFLKTIDYFLRLEAFNLTQTDYDGLINLCRKNRYTNEILQIFDPLMKKWESQK